jgi:hypothetical protein
MTPNQYRYKCPTEGCEIDTILVNVHEDVIEYFGFCCPFCQDHMVRDDTYQSERDTVLGDLLEIFDDDTNYNGWFVRETLIEKLRQAGEP